MSTNFFTTINALVHGNSWYINENMQLILIGKKKKIIIKQKDK